MPEMITRVAQALADNLQAALPDGVALDYEYAARAAIEAMRALPPNPDDPEKPPWSFYNSASHDELGNAVVTRSDWSAMIDAALAEKT